MKTHKRIFTAVLALTVVFAVSAAAFANEGGSVDIQLVIDNPVITVNGQAAAIDEEGTAPILRDGRTLLPVRAVVEAMGGDVAWDNPSMTATLTLNRDVITLTIDSATAYLNGTAETLDTAPILQNGRTMLPIRFIAESFGYTVKWDSESFTVTISNSASPSASAPDASEAGDILIVYYSRTGNTSAIARQIESLTGGRLFEIDTVEAYPENYDDVTAQAQKEKDEGFRPALSTHVENMDQYSTIFIGHPIWWGTIPMPVASFLEEYDFSGKTIIPFCTHGGSQAGSSVSDIAALTPGAEILEGFAVSGARAAQAESDVAQWLERLNLTTDRR